MHQTVYIDVDEEITSILDRVRQERVVDIFLVVPKGAMLLNSIINLKLLRKEAEKMGKAVVIVAPNDKQAKRVIERAGIKAEDYNQRMNKQYTQTKVPSVKSEAEQIEQVATESVKETRQRVNQKGLDLGSASFFSKKAPANQKQISPVKTPVRKNVVKEQPREMLNEMTTPPNNSQQDAQPNGGQFKQVEENTSNGASARITPKEDKEFDYFNNVEGLNNPSVKKRTSSSFGKKSLIVVAIFIVIALLGGGGWYMVNYPKLNLIINPLQKEISKEIKLVAKDQVGSVNMDEKIIPGEYLEISLEKELEFTASGEKTTDENGARAKGFVTVQNYFSSTPQRLVKTTRVLSKSGKLFRLAKSVMVPGLKGEKPGKIDVPVYADKLGSDFNIEKDIFTIEGFKSSPKKYEKFKVTSAAAMTGGMSSTDSKTKKVVTKTDLDNARKKTMEALENSLSDEIKKHLKPGQKVAQSSVDKEIVSSKASHLVDTFTDKFSYKIVYKIKLMSFYEEDVRSVVEKIIKKDLDRQYKLEPDFKIEIKKGIADLEKKSLVVYVNAKGNAWFEINKEELKRAVAGANAEETKRALSEDIGVWSAEIKPSPAWSSKSPSNVDKISIEVIKKDEKMDEK